MSEIKSVYWVISLKRNVKIKRVLISEIQQCQELLQCLKVFKGIVHPKMKVLSFIHPQFVPKRHEFLSSVDNKKIF